MLTSSLPSPSLKYVPKVSGANHHDLGQAVIPVQQSYSSASTLRSSRGRGRIQHLCLPMTSGGALKGYLELDLKIKMRPLKQRRQQQQQQQPRPVSLSRFLMMR